MKFDEKTGKPIPESRGDEIKLTLEQLNSLRKQTNGQNDKLTEICTLLADINVSLGILVDIASVSYNKFVAQENPAEGEQPVEIQPEES